MHMHWGRRTGLRAPAWLVGAMVAIGLVVSLRLALAAQGDCFPVPPLVRCLPAGAPTEVGLHIASRAFGGTGLRGEADALAGYGVQGLASTERGTGVGVRGQSDAPGGTGVIGTANAPSGPTIGVFGFSLSPRGTGVIGHSHKGTGVAARSSSGTAVYAESSSGFALQAVGNVAQSRSKSGLVKALLRIEGEALLRCYNSQAGSAAAAESCAGFRITGSAGDYVITFPSDFAIDDRYVIVSAEGSGHASPCCLVQHSFPTPHQVRVGIVDLNGTAVGHAFSVVIF